MGEQNERKGRERENEGERKDESKRGLLEESKGESVREKEEQDEGEKGQQEERKGERG